MGWEKRPRPCVRLLYLLIFVPVTQGQHGRWAMTVEAHLRAHHHRHGRSRSTAFATGVRYGATAAKVRLSSASICHRSTCRGRQRPFAGGALLQPADQQHCLRRGRKCFMGVAGLTTYINHNLKGAVASEELREGDTLAIDGSGWMFQLLAGERVDHGGDYDLLHQAVVREVTRLRKAGLNLMVYMDGPTRKMKAATAEVRRDEEQAKFANLYGYTLDGGGAFVGVGMAPDRSVESFPLPKLARRQFYASLRTMGVRIVECPGEADQEVAKASAEDESGRTFAVGSDSDFFIFERCRYIHFDDLKLPQENEDGTPGDGLASARVWTRARLAEVCGITEQQAVEWAILLGNDYTRELTFPGYGQRNRKPEKTLDYVRSIGPNVKVEESLIARRRRRRPAAILRLDDGGSSSSRDACVEGEEDGEEVDVFEEEEDYGEEEYDVVGEEDLLAEDYDELEEELEGVQQGVIDVSSSSQVSTGVAEGDDADNTKAMERGEVNPSTGELLPLNAELNRRRTEEMIRAIEFSRALYALEPLDRFPDDVEVLREENAEGEGGIAAVGAAAAAVAAAAAADEPGGLKGAEKAAGNRMLRRMMRRRKRAAKYEGKGRDGELEYGVGEFNNALSRGRKMKKLNLNLVVEEDDKEEAPRPARLDTVEAQLKTELLKRPFGDAVFEALQRTVDEEEAVAAGGEAGAAEADGSPVGQKIWNRAPRIGGGGGGGDAEEEKEEERLERERVEAAARRTALWTVALGHRKELPPDVRVTWPDVLLSVRYQKNLLEVYEDREALEKSESARGSSSSSSSEGGSRASAARKLKAGKAGMETKSAAVGFGAVGAGGRKKNRSAATSAASSSSPSSSAAAGFIMPRDHFHGPTFHALLHEYRVENSAEAEKISAKREEIQEEVKGATAEREVTKDRILEAKLRGEEEDEETEARGVGGEGRNGEHLNGGDAYKLPAVPALTSAIPMAVPQQPVPATTAPDPTLPETNAALPIDAYREKILEHVRNNRVTVIHGETGSGKSTRIPVMLVEEALDLIEAGGGGGTGGGRGGVQRPRMFVSQPRRAATRALVRRVRQEAERSGRGWAVGLRLGHGVREGPATAEVTFATTGYLARLLASNPGVLDSHTHLIIDEVHERSVDTDLLCLFAKKLIETHPTLRLIVMSATISANLLSNYYGLSSPPVFVGARRFPVREVYVDELAKELSYRQVLNKACESIEIATSDANAKVTAKVLSLQTNLAVQVARAVGSPGSAVLIFVPGMATILEIMNLFELISSADITYKVIPFHSDLPKEELMTAFEPVGEGEVKIVVATNSAESSITLPDVDNVICFGSCKEMVYDSRTNRQTLTPVWISRASAVQRAGRTGRVRPGTVYKLYSRTMGEEIMAEHGMSEMLRLPLDALILDLKNVMPESPVIPILESAVEPPNLEAVHRSFKSLHEMGFISSPDDKGVLTDTGRFASGLGVDLELGRMVALGGRLGVLSEAVAMAVVLSHPPPFIRASQMVTSDPAVTNAIVGQSFLAQSVFDRGLYSDTLATLRVLREYLVRAVGGNTPPRSFCRLFALSYPRTEQLVATLYAINSRASELAGEAIPLVPRDPAGDGELANTLRLLLVWTFPRNLIKMRVDGKRHAAVAEQNQLGKPVQVVLQGHAITAKHLSYLIPTVYPGMKDITGRPLHPFYKFVYQNPSRATAGPFAASSRLWHLLNDLRQQTSSSSSFPSPCAFDGGEGARRAGKDGRLKGGRDEAEMQEQQQQQELNVEKEGEEEEDKVACEPCVASGREVNREGVTRDGRVDDGVAVDGLNEIGVSIGLEGREAQDEEEEEEEEGETDEEEEEEAEETNEEEEEDEEQECDFFPHANDAASDPLVALVYSITPETVEERRSRDDLNPEAPRSKPSGQRRVCIVMSRRSFGPDLYEVLKIGGSRTWWANVKGKVLTENVEGIGPVETLDLALSKSNVHAFRAMLEERAGCAYAVTDAPMIQLEMSGEREATGEMLQEVFGVSSPFEGGRNGAPTQVIEFPRGDDGVVGCKPLLDDVPLGARILVAMANANRAGGRALHGARGPVWDGGMGAFLFAAGERRFGSDFQRKLRVWNDPIKRREKTEITLSLKQSIWVTYPGITSSSRLSPYPSSGNGGAESAAAPKNETRGLVYTPANSVSSSIVYQGRNRHVYAVASDFIQLPRGNAISEAITVFPVGRSWLGLALLCAGAARTELPGYLTAELAKPQMTMAAEFAESFWAASPQDTSGKLDKNGFRARLQEIFPPVLKDIGGILKTEVGASHEERLLETATESAEGASYRFHGGFDNASDYRGSPLAILKDDPALWKHGEREPAGLRQAAENVGKAAAAAAAATAARTVGRETPAAAETAPATVSTPRLERMRMKMSPEVGRALMGWSRCLWEAGRGMASRVGLQAVIMGILSAHRRNVLAGCEVENAVSGVTAPAAAQGLGAVAGEGGAPALEVGRGGAEDGTGTHAEAKKTSAEQGEGPDGMGGGAGGGSDWRGISFVYGDVDRLEADIFAATGIENALHLEVWTEGLTGGERVNVAPDFKVASILQGVPWLSFVKVTGGGREGRSLVWRPPAVVADALDADLDADPTSWLVGFGTRGRVCSDRDGGEGGEVGGNHNGDDILRRRQEQKRVGVMGLGAEGGGEEQKHPCLQQLEAYLAHRDDMDLAAGLFKAGFYHCSYLVLGRIIAAAAIPEALGATSAVGKRRQDRLPALRAAGPPPSWAALEADVRNRRKTGSNPFLVKRFEELAGFRLVRAQGELLLGGIPRTTFDRIAEGVPGLQESTLGGHVISDGRITKAAMKIKKGTRRGGSRGRGGGVARLSGRQQHLAHLCAPDDRPSLAFSPRYEAARFLADLLLASIKRDSPQVTKIATLERQEADLARVEGRLCRLFDTDLKWSPDNGFALLITAALKRLEDKRAATHTPAAAAAAASVDEDDSNESDQADSQQGVGGCVDVGGQQDGRFNQQDGAALQSGFTLGALHEELQDLITLKVTRTVMLEGLSAIPGVVLGERERLWWTFDADVASSLIASVVQEIPEAGNSPVRPEGLRGWNVAGDLQGFLTKAFNLGRPEVGDVGSTRRTGRRPQQEEGEPSTTEPPPAETAAAPEDVQAELLVLSEKIVVPAEENR